MDPQHPSPAPEDAEAPRVEPRGQPPRRVPGVRRRTGGIAGTVAVTMFSLLGVALLGLTWAGREASAPPVALSIVVTFLPYLYALFAAGCFALWAAVPDRWEPPAWLAASVLIAATLWGPGWASGGETAEGEPIRVMSWNLRRLWGGPDDGGDAFQCAVQAIDAADPDVLALLEVSRDDVERLQSALGMSCVHSTYLASTSETKGGLASCTRGDRWRLKSGEAQRFVDDEDWYYVFSEVEQGGQLFNVLAVHLYPYSFVTKKLRKGVGDLEPEDLEELSHKGEQTARGQSDQSAALLERVSRFRDPTLVAGDFNSTRDAALHAALRETLTDTWERGGAGFGATMRFFERVPLRIDYVYASDDFAVRHAEVSEVGCSDHSAVITDLVLRTPDPAVGGSP